MATEACQGVEDEGMEFAEQLSGPNDSRPHSSERRPEPRTFVKVGSLGSWTEKGTKKEYPMHGSIDVLRTNDAQREVWLSQNGPGVAKSFVRLSVLTEIGRKKLLEGRAEAMQAEADRKARKDAAYRQAHGET